MPSKTISQENIKNQTIKTKNVMSKTTKTTKSNKEDKKIAASIKAQHAAEAKAKADAKAAKEKEKAAAQAAKEKAKADAEKLNAAHGLAITKAAEKGVAIASKAFGAQGLTENLGAALSKGVNENISVTPTGIVIKKGYTPTEVEITEAISGLCGINEETAKFRTTVTWAIGDAAVLADSFKGGADRVVAQAIKERGVSKHTVMQAAVVCREFAPEDRIAGVSFTHHQELRNYRKSIKNKKGYEKLIEELREQAKDDAVMSCSELRERLQLLAGKKKDEEEEKEKKPSKDDGEHTYLYVDQEGIAKFSKGFRSDLCSNETGVTFDLTDMTALRLDGSLYYSIEEVEPAKADEAKSGDEPKDEPAKADKPKTDKKKKSEIPD